MNKLILTGEKLLIFILLVIFSACSNETIVPQIKLDIEEENYFVKNMEFSSSEGEKTFSFNTTVDWSILVTSPQDDGTWCTVTPSSGSEGDNVITIKVKENIEDKDRKAILTFSVGTTLTKTITVVQEKNILLPSYTSYVTISGDEIFGYTFYSDFGYILRPTMQSVQEILPGLSKSDVKRAVVAFDLTSETENGKDLLAGKTYDIILRQSYYANYAIPTYNTIDIANNTAAADSLVNKNQYINNVNDSIWAINGYINTQMTLNYDQSKAFSVNTYYNSEKDVDVDQKTLSLNIYYNSNSNSNNAHGTSVFSFKLPEKEYMKFASTSINPSQDSIKVILNAISDYDTNEMRKVGECNMAISDFYLSQRGY